MLWQDLRQYLDQLAALGDLKTITGASWDEDIGAITELMTERQGPALLFDDIPGYPKGYRVASNLFTTARRTAIVAGVDPDPQQTIAERFREVLSRLRPIPPEVVRDGPILENVLTGDAIDLFKFPTPKWHENDGGRYIGTGVCVIQRDPETDVVNVGAYRVSVQNPQTCSIFIEPNNDGDTIRRKYWARGEKCPVIVGVGQEPLLMALAGPTLYRTPREMSEFDVAGFLHGEPYPVIRGEFTGLPMPAHGEIAIEGFIVSPQERLELEGPFGEWTGYYAHRRQPETVIEVKAIYHRNDPIIHGQPPVRPVGCTYNPNFGGDELEPRRRLEQAGIPGVKRVFTLGYPFLRAVAIDQQYATHVDDVIRILEPGGDQHNGNHIWVLVDDDIDVSNPAAVFWAIASRCAPEHGIQVIPGTAVWQLDPRIPPDLQHEPGVTGRWRYPAHNLIINACRPWAWKDDFPPVNVNSDALRERTLEKWKEVFAELPAHIELRNVMATQSVLRLASVSKLYGPIRAADQVTLEVQRGEVFTLLGPSGCGKTTTLRLVAGLERLDEGEIYVGDRVVASAAKRVFVPAHKRQMGMVFQSYAIWPHLTVFENVAYPLRARRTPGAQMRERVAWALDLVGLNGLEERPGPLLSGGQQQRVALARALVYEPDILLLDEPFSNLDAKLREHMRVEVRSLQRRLGITVLFVTHDQTEALSLSDRIAVMEGGHVVQVGGPRDLYDSPKADFVRDFLGKSVVLPGRVARTAIDGVEVVLDSDPHPLHVPATAGAADGVDQPVYLAIRPEDIVVSSHDHPSAGNNRIDGTIDTLLFVGDRYECQIALGPSRIITYLPRHTRHQEGETVSLHFPPEALSLWRQ